MGVPRGTRAPLNPVSSACNDCVSQGFIQQQIPSCCCGSVQGTCSTLQGRDWWRAHENKSGIIVLKELKLGTTGRIWCSFSKKEKKPQFCIFPVWVPSHDLQGLVDHLWSDGNAPSGSEGRAGMALKTSSLSELAAGDSVHFKNTLVGKVSVENALVWSDF